MSIENIKQSINNWIQLDTLGSFLTYGVLGVIAVVYLMVY